MSAPKVIEELDRWGRWYLETTGVDGFRLDAVKHIRATYFTHWLQMLRQASGRPLPAMGEYWKDDLGTLTYYLDQCGQVMRLFDVPLHFQFHRLSGRRGQYGSAQPVPRARWRGPAPTRRLHLWTTTTPSPGRHCNPGSPVGASRWPTPASCSGRRAFPAYSMGICTESPTTHSAGGGAAQAAPGPEALRPQPADRLPG